MADEDTPQETAVEETSASGNDSESVIAAADAAAVRLEKANEEMKLLLLKKQAMNVEETLGGVTSAGGKPTIDPNADAKKLIENMGYSGEVLDTKEE